MLNNSSREALVVSVSPVSRLLARTHRTKPLQESQ
jgi:hypothetical protein